MAEVQIPLSGDAVPSASQAVSANKDILIDRLDALLEQYLHTLDEYEKLTQQLSEQLSSAYFSLTQANFHNRSGVHYGQDSYDQRVQATRRIVVNGDGDSVRYSTVSTLSSPSPRAESKSCAGEKEKTTQSEDDAEARDGSRDQSTEYDAEARDPSHDQSTDDDAKAKDASQDQSTDDASNPASPANEPKKKSEPTKPTAKDPIRMFGILVPPALRTAQASFIGAVDGPVVRLAEVTGELRALEREIGRARKAVRKA